MDEVTIKGIRAELGYDPLTGHFWWKCGKPGRRKGLIMKAKRHCYLQITYNYKVYRAHRLAFLLMGENLPDNIDHINGDPSDNRWCNLRPCSHQENLRNTKKRSDNTSGYKGVCWHSQMKKWRAYIVVNGGQKSLGLFDTKEEASLAYRTAAEKFYGGFHRYE